jgi:hypothetical protein
MFAHVFVCDAHVFVCECLCVLILASDSSSFPRQEGVR